MDNEKSVKNAIRGAGYTLEEFAEGKLGMTRNTFYYHLRKKPLENDFVKNVYSALGIKQNVSQETKKQYTYEVEQTPRGDFMEVPVLTIEAQAGYFKSGGDEEILKGLDGMLVPHEYEKGHYMVVEIKGDSMDDGSSRALKEGDKVLVKELPKEFWINKLHVKRYIWVIVHKEGIVFKEILKHDLDNKTITLHSWNSFYKDTEVKMKDVYKLFYVKQLVSRIIIP